MEEACFLLVHSSRGLSNNGKTALCNAACTLLLSMLGLCKSGGRSHLARLLGRTSMEKTCLPVHSSRGLSSAGCGSCAASSASPIWAMSCPICPRLYKQSLLVSRKLAVRKSCNRKREQ